MLVSPVSVWEAAIKQATGKLDAPPGLAELLEGDDVRELPITFEHARIAGALPLHHRDPFDRMLIAQAQAERATIVSADRAMERYDIPLLRAGPV